MRYGQQRTLTHGWSSKATRPRAVKQTEYDWSYVHEAVCPETDESSAIILPPYSPELNEIERIWPQIRLRGLSNQALPSGEAFNQAGVEAWNRVTPKVIKSNCRTTWMERNV